MSSVLQESELSIQTDVSNPIHETPNTPPYNVESIANPPNTVTPEPNEQDPEQQPNEPVSSNAETESLNVQKPSEPVFDINYTVSSCQKKGLRTEKRRFGNVIKSYRMDCLPEFCEPPESNSRQADKRHRKEPIIYQSSLDTKSLCRNIQGHHLQLLQALDE